MSRLGVGDVVHLLLGDVEQRGELLPVACGLIVHHYELRVREQRTRRRIIQEILHVLRNARWESIAFAKPAPRRGEKHTAVRVVVDHMELVKVHMGAFARLPILRHAV